MQILTFVSNTPCFVVNLWILLCNIYSKMTWYYDKYMCGSLCVKLQICAVKNCSFWQYLWNKIHTIWYPSVMFRVSFMYASPQLIKIHRKWSMKICLYHFMPCVTCQGRYGIKANNMCDSVCSYPLMLCQLGVCLCRAPNKKLKIVKKCQNAKWYFKNRSTNTRQYFSMLI